MLTLCRRYCRLWADYGRAVPSAAGSVSLRFGFSNSRGLKIFAGCDFWVALAESGELFQQTIQWTGQIAISIIAAIIAVISMTTISVTEDVKEKLLKVASELQIKLGRRVDLNDALRFLVDQREKNPQLLEEACSPTTGVKEALEELEIERKLDDERLERKISHRHKRTN